MKIMYIDLKTNGKKYFCKDVNETFEVKDGNLIATTRDFSMAELFKMEFEEVGEKPKNPYDRVNIGEEYYFIEDNGAIDFYEDDSDGYDDKLFNNVNYFNNLNYAEYIAFKENLMRRIDKFAWEHNARVIDWNDSSTKYYIAFDYNDDELRVCCNYTVQSNNIYFTSREIADRAIEEFKEDLMKLYTWKFDF